MSDLTLTPGDAFGGAFARADDDWNVQPIFDRFEHVVALHGDKVAVDDGLTRFTYCQLSRAVLQLARDIAALVPSGHPVGILLPNGARFPIAALACLAVGRPYVPIDPAFPAERNEQVVREAGLSAVIVDGAPANIPFVPASIPCFDISDSLQEAGGTKVAHASADGPAVILYTSGSSGQPKGICYDQRAILERVIHETVSTQLCSEDRIFLLSSPGTIGGLRVPLLALLNGATLYWADPHQIGVDGALRILQNARPTAGFAVPALLRTLLGLPGARQAFTHARVIRTGGDVILSSDLTLWQNVLPRSCRIFISLTSTEMPAVFQWFVPPDWEADSSHLPVGYPRPGISFTIVDDNGAPVPVGEAGELVVKSRYLALGHWQDGRLQPGPFQTDPDDSTVRIFNTGDLVRMREDGLAEMIGRKDRRLKIRGFRIEPGDVENVLRACAGVADAALIARRTGEEVTSLVAYVVPRDPGNDSFVEALTNELAMRLPLHMRPSQIRLIDAMPQLPGFKIDIPALEKLDEKQRATGDATASVEQYVAPRNSFEEIVAGVWREVLKLGRVGAHDNFFELGGQSLLAAQVLSRLAEILKVELSLQDFFESPTVSALAAEAERRLGAGEAIEAAPIVPTPRGSEGKLPLSFAQQRLWILDRLLPDEPVYNIPAALRLQGRLDVSALQRSLDALVARHEVLRTRYALSDREPLQVIDPPQSVALPLTDLSAMAEVEREARARQVANAHAREPFDLEAGPLLRVQLLRLAPEEHLLLYTVHHIAFDGWSVGVFERELFATYGDLVEGREPRLPVLPIQYADYALWQRRWLQGEVLERQLAYWKAQLAELPVLQLPTDRARPPVPSQKGARLDYDLPGTLLHGIKALGRREGATLFMTLLAAFQLLLYRYSGQEDIAVGSPIAGRRRTELEGLVGFFVNTLVLRADLSGNPSFRELLARVRRSALGAYTHQDLPFEKLVEELSPARDLSRNPLFQAMLALQSAPGATHAIDGIEVSRLPIECHSAMFDLTLSVSESADGLHTSWEYASDLFDAVTVERMAGHFERVLESIVADPDQRIGQLPLLSEAERHRLLVEWNDTARNDPAEAPIHQLIAAHAARTPEAVAVMCGSRALSYGELDRRANQLAHALRRRGVGPDVLVGLCVNRTPDMIVALLGILKAGGAYVPLDPDYPEERLAFMLKDSGVRVLVTEESLQALLPPVPAICEVICLDRDAKVLAAEHQNDPRSEVEPANLAYAIYTSGSTGQPKAALLTHRGLHNLAVSEVRLYGIGPQSRILQFSSLSFDTSLSEIAMAVCSGATLYLERRDAILPGPDLERYLEREKITVLSLTPSALAMLDPAAAPSVEQVIVGGEPCPAELAARWAGRCRFFNAYGPTEATVTTTYVEYRDGALPPNIGRPLPNMRVYLLNRWLQPVPVGVAGELYIGGIGVARGYLNRPELTAKTFVPDPFSTTPGALMYRTGDFARWRSDGQIEFVGRIDDQVKLRGFRIELGEIEAVMMQHPQVRACTLIVREDTPGQRRLVAYIAPGTRGKAPAASALRAHLKRTIPDYMVPAHFVVLDDLPLAPNGKLDRRALPAPERSSSEAIYVAPRTATEQVLASVWSEVLGLERVGVHENFFDAGGHSLAAVRLMSGLRAAAGVNLPLRNLFEHPTVAGLAEIIDELSWLEKSKAPAASGGIREEILL